jgi:hypothetical protein
MKSFNLKRFTFIIIMLASTIYAGLYIERTSFVIDGVKTYALFDDAMISMRYAKNLASGEGLVWNPGGERVEGFSNPLWVGFMALFHLFPIPSNTISLFIQISGAVFLLLNLIIVKWVTEYLTDNWVVPMLAVVLTAFYIPLNNYGLQGMEVCIVILLNTAAVWITMRSLKTGVFSALPFVILGVGTLFRIDMAVPYLALLVFLVFSDPQHRKRHLAWGLGILAIFIIGQTLFRLWYYGELVPNTYYLKVVGYPLFSRVARGLFVLFKFVWNLNWLLFLLPFSLLLFKRDRNTLLLFIIFLAWTAYSVYVGGDAWEHRGGANRYISIAMPLFFILFCLAADQLRLAIYQKASQTTKFKDWFTSLGMVVIVMVSMLNFNSLLDTGDLSKWILRSRLDFTLGTERYVGMGLSIKEVTTENARIAVVTAGIIPYFADRYAIDLLGKNDKVIAHKAPRYSSIFDIRDYRPGHNKWDYAYSIGELKPDLVAQWWGDNAVSYLENEYIRVEIGGIPMFVLRDSPNIYWDKISLTQ